MVDNEKVIGWSYYTSWSREQLVERIKELEKLTQNLKEMEISLIEKNKFLKEMSMEDYLTKVYNYGTIIEIIERQIKYSKRKGETFCILMIDIDDFKSVNDNFGHVFGDEILIKISKEIKKNIRKNDYVGRFGGEEFIVIFNNTELSEAIIISERIRKSIEKLEFFRSLKITISGGVKEYFNESCKEIIDAADNFLYKAKGLGKNRICY
ncbi:GGDEF domain-containing protein [Clostridium tetani]|uniref:GGDEF domain-containing protein n=1 Tax=Clostridium tetani TaxID=1513 RepID=A0ABY0ET24_CLOTA|nr:GGDEF domain-containing protein [Clostridium tetani]RXI57135.1 GGDEF domain-containing protein [Clostridium tetani]RXI67221.1 GGDEF domain-containing protein [Clostridium tetani]CDI48760.1 diguanylate cyclase/phosphodiesterase [Clostridium tetani 12124569]